MLIPRSPPTCYVSTIQFSDGTSTELGENDIVVLVGPNNAGKSTVLRDIIEVAQGQLGIAAVDVTITKAGASDDVKEWLLEWARPNDDSADPTYQYLGAGIRGNAISQSWQNSRHLAELTPFFFRHVAAEQRLQAAQDQGALDVYRQPVQNPLHMLFISKEIEAEVSQAFQEAFGVPLFLNRWAGSRLRLHLGIAPVDTHEEWTVEFLNEAGRRPFLSQQGDGMRSFVACLLETVVARHPIVLLDEPEAFLHPPQARTLGRFLVDKKPMPRQLFVATHSADVLRGILDASSDNVRVIRLRREGDVNFVSELRAEAIQELWSDPLLRSSRLLDGVFHEQAVVVEGDADARFYGALSEAALAERPATQRSDVLFVHTGGNNRTPVAVDALRSAGVPVAAIVDFDTIGNLGVLEKLVLAAGGDWADVEPQVRQVAAALQKLSPPLNKNQFKEKVAEALGGNDAFVSEDAAKAIRAALKTVSPWRVAKEHGVGGLPPGDIRVVWQALDDTLRSLGIFLVPVGELERFYPKVGGHGPGWCVAFFERRLDLAGDPDLQAARNFVLEVVERPRQQQRE